MSICYECGEEYVGQHVCQKLCGDTCRARWRKRRAEFCIHSKGFNNREQALEDLRKFLYSANRDIKYPLRIRVSRRLSDEEVEEEARRGWAKKPRRPRKPKAKKTARTEAT